MIFMILLLLAFFLFISNNHIMVTKHCLTGRQAPDDADPLTIVHISDLHNKNFGFRQNILLKKIRLLHPDILVITGDLVDRAPFANALTFIREASRICPIYYVRGNHECLAGNYEALERQLLKYRVTVLKNTSVSFSKNNRTYRITGMDDPIFQGYDSNYLSIVQKTLDQITDPEHRNDSGSDFHILLSHRPELFHLYSSYPFDLVLCGHAHGGQFRLPFTDGLYAPNQGIFPRYTSGMHRENGTTQIISRGLGNSTFPFRLFNDPQIISITIN